MNYLQIIYCNKYLVIDCDLPECSSTSCIGEQVQCIRTCENGIYGDAGCLESDIIQTHTCLPGDCSKFLGFSSLTVWRTRKIDQHRNNLFPEHFYVLCKN
jgi:hypothetical protein